MLLSNDVIYEYFEMDDQTSGISSDIDKTPAKLQTNLRSCVYNIPSDDMLW